MTDFQFLNADRSIDVIVRTDFINFGSWVGNLTVHQKEGVNTDAERKLFANIQRNKTTIAELVAFANANSLSIIAIPIGKPVNARWVSLGNLLLPTTSFTATPSAAKITLNWAPVPGAASYQVDRATTSNFTTGLVTNYVTTTDTFFPDASLPSATHYYYRIRAVQGSVVSSNVLADASTP